MRGWLSRLSERLRRSGISRGAPTPAPADDCDPPDDAPPDPDQDPDPDEGLGDQWAEGESLDDRVGGGHFGDTGDFWK